MRELKRHKNNTAKPSAPLKEPQPKQDNQKQNRDRDWFMKGKWHLKPREGKVIGHGERSGGERDLREWGLKISMVMVLTETNNQHR